MKKRDTKRIIINDRDVKLFNYLFEIKVATVEQINRDVFIGKSKSTVFKRLRKLVEYKYLTRTPVYKERSVQFAYSISKTTLKNHILGPDCWKEAVKRCQSDSVEHDLVLTDIRRKLLGLKQVVEYHTENVLLSDSFFVQDKKYDPIKRHHSDGALIIKLGDQEYNLALEYEHTLKYGPRYTSKISFYSTESRIHGVIYLCRDKNMVEKIKKAALTCHSRAMQMVFYTTIDEFFKEPNSIKLTNSDGTQKLQLE